MAEIVEGTDTVQSLKDLREGNTRTYCNVQLGEGTYTLYAGTGSDGEPVYGIMDEAAKINVNTADATTLERIPGMTPDLAAAIKSQKKQEKYRDLNDLLIIEQVDLLTLYGEDQNGNGILDPNENDGDQSWPPDNADNRLDSGLAAYLTTWSAARNVTAFGDTRVNLNEASAEQIADAVKGMTPQEAESIVAHREKSKFSTIVDLLDVELVEKVAEEPKAGEPNQEKPPQPPQGPAPKEAQPDNPTDAGKNNQGPAKDAQNGAPSAPPEGAPPPESENKPKGPDEGPKPTVKGTGKKAFDMKRFRQMADLVTTQKEEVLEGIVNINTAPYEILACLPGIDEPVARQIVHDREGRENGFTTIADLLDVDGVSEEVFKQMCARVCARSDVFSVRSFGVLGNGELYRCTGAVIDRTKETVRLVYWREND